MKVKEMIKKRWGVFVAPIVAGTVASSLLAAGAAIGGASLLLGVFDRHEPIAFVGMLCGTVIACTGALALINVLRNLPVDSLKKSAEQEG